MSNLTPNLNLFKYDVSMDANVPFSITEALNNNWDIIDDKYACKVDLDAQNLSAEGKSLISGLGMPSDKYIDLTLGASGSTYTAPANGWFTIARICSGNTAFCGFYVFDENKSSEIYGINTHGTYVIADYLALIVPVRKGLNLKVTYRDIGSTGYFRFFYAEGSK